MYEVGRGKAHGGAAHQRSQNKALTNLLISSSLVLQFDNCLLCQSFMPLHSVNELLTMKPYAYRLSCDVSPRTGGQSIHKAASIMLVVEEARDGLT